ncbi:MULTISPECIES: FliM/FliN family flagellar motor switch protein [Rhodobacterales]|uniref:flagellar motor switch protein FliM n=1 Tax=Roseobacter sp. N2S TaxID=2663844 RepID=UPI002858EDFC|nr:MULTISPECIES: FliM/FliN family flagellar motor switch protein [Rhodobacterales]MDR6266748.1 flagellar motor switch protein FliM [Roseobacter sp. N2S]
MQAKTPDLQQSDSEMTRSVQEELISQASAGIAELPMLDIIFSRMAVSLVSAFKSKAAFMCDISFDEVVYRNWEDVVADVDKFGICASVEAKPWGGTMSVMLDSALIFSALEVQMGGKPRPGTAPQRPVSVIERQIARYLVDMILADLSTNMSRLTEASFLVDTMEVPQQMPALQGGKTPCAVAKMTVDIGDCTGSFSIIIPMPTLEPVQDKLSKMFLGDKLGGDKSWREHILSNINGSSVKVTARVHQLSIPLVDILAWKPGTTIDLGVSDDKEISIICSGIPVFQGYAGKHRGGRIGFRVMREVEGDDLNPAEAEALGIQPAEAEVNS